MFYVYIYLNKLKPGRYKYQNIEFNYEPFYVGKGKGNRYLFHLSRVKNSCKYKKSNKFSIIENLLSNNQEPEIIIIKQINEQKALELEKEIITKIGRIDINTGPLTNRNDGGIKPQDNYKHDIESKNKISIGLINSKPQERYIVISPNGEIYENVKLKSFCIDFCLDYQKMRKSSNKGKIRIKKLSMSNKETINCIGWETINKKIIKEDNRKIRYKLISPDGNKFEIYIRELNDKCISLGIDTRTISYYRNRGCIDIKNTNQCKKESINCQGWQFIDSF